MKLLNLKEVSKILRISIPTLYLWKSNKKILPFIKIGNSLRVSERDLTEFIKKNKVKCIN